MLHYTWPITNIFTFLPSFDPQKYYYYFSLSLSFFCFCLQLPWGSMGLGLLQGRLAVCQHICPGFFFLISTAFQDSNLGFLFLDLCDRLKMKVTQGQILFLLCFLTWISWGGYTKGVERSEKLWRGGNGYSPSMGSSCGLVYLGAEAGPQGEVSEWVIHLRRLGHRYQTPQGYPSWEGRRPVSQQPQGLGYNIGVADQRPERPS